MESRKHMKKPGGRLSPSSELPSDFTQMVRDVYTKNFAAGLKALAETAEGEPAFEAHGVIYADEIVLGVSLTIEGQIGATTVYCSVDFDPKASTPKAEDLLGLCVDAIGSFFDQFLDPEKPELLEQIASGTLASLEDVPFDWTQLEFEKKRLYLKIDKANPKLDAMTDDWLAKNDPDFQAEEDELEEESEKLFVTGPNRPATPKKPGRGGNGSVH